MLYFEPSLVNDAQRLGPQIVRKFRADILQKLHVKLLRQHCKSRIFAVRANTRLGKRCARSVHGLERLGPVRRTEHSRIGRLGATAFAQIKKAGQAVRVDHYGWRGDIRFRDRLFPTGDIASAPRPRWPDEAKRCVADKEGRNLRDKSASLELRQGCGSGLGRAKAGARTKTRARLQNRPGVGGRVREYG